MDSIYIGGFDGLVGAAIGETSCDGLVVGNEFCAGMSSVLSYGINCVLVFCLFGIGINEILATSLLLVTLGNASSSQNF